MTTTTMREWLLIQWDDSYPHLPRPERHSVMSGGQFLPVELAWPTIGVGLVFAEDGAVNEVSCVRTANALVLRNWSVFLITWDAVDRPSPNQVDRIAAFVARKLAESTNQPVNESTKGPA